MSPSAALQQVVLASRRVLRSVDELGDEQMHAPSRLPNWTRAEVVAHLARNADGTRNMVEAAARGEVAAMYPGGAEQRAAGIAAGRGERAAALRSDLRRAVDRLAEAWSLLGDDDWERVGITSVKRQMRELPWVRLREVEIHHVDLATGYDASDWPVVFVNDALEEIFTTFSARDTSKQRPRDVEYRIVAADHERAWRVALRAAGVDVRGDDESHADGEARGWGCDVAAWLYGRDARGSGVTATGDIAVLRLPQWFPFA